MEVIAPSLTVGLNFDSPCVSPHHPLGTTTYFYSAPTSPVRLSALCRQDFHGGANYSVPFYWEEKPGIPKEEYISSTEEDDLKGTDFEFDSRGNSERCSLSADELFYGGKIRPLKPPPGSQYNNQKKPSDSPKSPRSPTKLIVQAFSPRQRKKDFDPFAAALEQTRKSNIQERGNCDKRGREKTISKKGARSLSPFRISDLLSNREPIHNHCPKVSPWHKKWKIKDLLLFRSASESWAMDKDQMKKKDSFSKKTHDENEVTESSFSSTASCESESSRRRSVPPISAHEFHYSVKRTVFEEMRKRRSLLAYRQGILGCLGFHRTVPEIHQSL